MSHTTLELFAQYAIGHIMEVIVVRRPIASSMASSRLKESHYESIVTDINLVEGSLEFAEIHNAKKLIKAVDKTQRAINYIENIDDQWLVTFVDGTTLSHLLTAKGVLQLVCEDPDDL